MYQKILYVLLKKFPLLRSESRRMTWLTPRNISNFFQKYLTQPVRPKSQLVTPSSNDPHSRTCRNANKVVITDCSVTISAKIWAGSFIRDSLEPVWWSQTWNNDWYALFNPARQDLLSNKRARPGCLRNNYLLPLCGTSRPLATIVADLLPLNTIAFVLITFLHQFFQPFSPDALFGPFALKSWAYCRLGGMFKSRSNATCGLFIIRQIISIKLRKLKWISISDGELVLKVIEFNFLTFFGYL